MTEAKSIVEETGEHMRRTMNKLLASLQAYNFVLQANYDAISSKDEALFDSLKKLENYLDPLELEPRNYFRCLLFLDLISELELFFSALVRLTILKNPKKIGSTQFKLIDILEAFDTDELIARAADEFLYKLLYKKPNEYLSEMCSVLSIDQSVVDPYWLNYTEAKARRDLGTHNDWKCNQTYLRKLSEAGITKNASPGESLIPDDNYFNETATSAAKLAQAMAEAVMEKHGTQDKV